MKKTAIFKLQYFINHKSLFYLNTIDYNKLNSSNLKSILKRTSHVWTRSAQNHREILHHVLDGSGAKFIDTHTHTRRTQFLFTLHAPYSWHWPDQQTYALCALVCARECAALSHLWTIIILPTHNLSDGYLYATSARDAIVARIESRPRAEHIYGQHIRSGATRNAPHTHEQMIWWMNENVYMIPCRCEFCGVSYRCGAYTHTHTHFGTSRFVTSANKSWGHHLAPSSKASSTKCVRHLCVNV